MLHRPIETAGIIGMWPGIPSVGRKPHSEKLLNEKRGVVQASVMRGEILLYAEFLSQHPVPPHQSAGAEQESRH